MAIENVVKAIAVTAELSGANLSPGAIAIMARDLASRYSEDRIFRALERCRMELTKPLTSGAVFERLAEDDGRPSGDEAWAIASESKDEAKTVVWNDEIQQAMAASRPVLDAGDKVGARMAFKDAYERIVRQARERGSRPVWTASFGWDETHRQQALESAERQGRICLNDYAKFLPAPSSGVVTALLGCVEAPSLGNADEDDRARMWIRKIRASMVASAKAKDERRQAALDAERRDLAERKKKAADMVAARLVGGDC